MRFFKEKIFKQVKQADCKSFSELNSNHLKGTEILILVAGGSAIYNDFANIYIYIGRERERENNIIKQLN